MAKTPMTKQCQRRNPYTGKTCSKFMQLLWVEPGSKVLPEGYQADECVVPVFFCPSCGEWDVEPTDPANYAWLIYEGTIDWDQARKDLSPDEFAALVQEEKEMMITFKNRPYRILPKF